MAEERIPRWAWAIAIIIITGLSGYVGTKAIVKTDAIETRQNAQEVRISIAENELKITRELFLSFNSKIDALGMRISSLENRISISEQDRIDIKRNLEGIGKLLEKVYDMHIKGP